MDKGTIKEFLKLDKWKVLIFVIFLSVNIGLIYLHNPITFFGSSGMEIGTYIDEYGIPFVFFTEECPLLPPEQMKKIECPTTTTFDTYFFIVDIIIWYIFSCLIMVGYTKIKK